MTNFFDDFSKKSRLRSEDDFNMKVENFDLPWWGNAAAGEMGELCNVIKKIARGDKFDKDGVTPMGNVQLEEEVGGVVAYLELICQRAGISLRDAIINTFNEKSKQIGSKHHLSKIYLFSKPPDDEQPMTNYLWSRQNDYGYTEQWSRDIANVNAQYYRIINNWE